MQKDGENRSYNRKEKERVKKRKEIYRLGITSYPWSINCMLIVRRRFVRGLFEKKQDKFVTAIDLNKYR